MKIKVCSTIIHPKEFPIPSSKGDKFYSVTASTLFSDGFCDCPSFTFRGASCKHLTAVEINRCRWMAKNKEEAKLTICPNCHEPTEFYEDEAKPV